MIAIKTDAINRNPQAILYLHSYNCTTTVNFPGTPAPSSPKSLRINSSDDDLPGEDFLVDRLVATRPSKSNRVSNTIL